MENYKPNSFKYKEEKECENERTRDIKTRRVIKNEVSVKKKGFFEKLKGSVISDDAGSLKSYLLNDILIPTLRDTIIDMIKNSADIVFKGRGRSRDSRGYSSSVSYRDYYERRNDYRADRFAYNDDVYSFNDIIFKTYDDADEQIEMMCDILDHYNCLSLADFYESVNKSNLIRYTDYDYGWTSSSFNRKRVRPIRVRDGYIIDLPKLIPLKN